MDMVYSIDIDFVGLHPESCKQFLHCIVGVYILSGSREGGATGRGPIIAYA